MAESGTRMKEAAALAEEAVRRNPEDPTYLDTLGYVYIKAGRFREAMAPLESALARLPASKDDRIMAARQEVLGHLAMARRGK